MAKKKEIYVYYYLNGRYVCKVKLKDVDMRKVVK